LGRKIVQFKTRNSDRHFSIHEDLLCANSEFFRQRFQKTRKAVEGECSICHEDLDPRKDDVTFCSSTCGQNVHVKCIEQWNGIRPIHTCPLCQRVWMPKSEPLVRLDAELDIDAVQMYLEWLYTNCLSIPEDVSRNSEEICLFILKAWNVSEFMKDTNFRHALVAEYVSVTEVEEGTYFWSESAEFAFGDNGSEEMQQFVVDVFLTRVWTSWYDEWAHTFPNAFIHAVCRTVLMNIQEVPGIDEVLQYHANGDYVLEKTPEQEEVAEVAEVPE
jgi:hypothetical protein